MKNKKRHTLVVSEWLHSEAKKLSKSGDVKTSIPYVIEKAFAEYYKIKSPNINI